MFRHLILETGKAFWFCCQFYNNFAGRNFRRSNELAFYLQGSEYLSHLKCYSVTLIFEEKFRDTDSSVLPYIKGIIKITRSRAWVVFVCLFVRFFPKLSKRWKLTSNDCSIWYPLVCSRIPPRIIVLSSFSHAVLIVRNFVLLSLDLFICVFKTAPEPHEFFQVLKSCLILLFFVSYIYIYIHMYALS